MHLLQFELVVCKDRQFGILAFNRTPRSLEIVTLLDLAAQFCSALSTSARSVLETTSNEGIELRLL
jgi:hypothetical protein